ncbi:MAG: 1,4-dihydroxy-2-naphthoate polyprenyltransferase [Actinomycetes bacterium]
MTTREQWIEGARPRTLPAAVAPVLVGTAIAVFESSLRIGIALLALIVALAFQVGVNYSNDYSDGIRGTDEVRVGPVRLVGQGLAQPEAVRKAAFLAYGIGSVAGLLMVAFSGLWILVPVGIASVAAAWFYTGGTKPYGYLGLGEIFVFVFFGLVAVVGTSASQTGHITSLSLLGGVACGAMSCAILVVNNLRDRETDQIAGKMTLAVRLGDKHTRELYRTLILVAYAMPVIMTGMTSGPKFAYVCLLTMLSVRRPLMAVQNGAQGGQLIPVLIDTSKVLLLFAMSLTVGISASPIN